VLEVAQQGTCAACTTASPARPQLHLANKYGKLSADQLGTASQWTLFANSTLSEAFFNAQQR
jgi:hypothetical protein